MMSEETKVNWGRTKTALKTLLVLLKCTSCDKDLKDPCSFSICNHYFCRKCALDLVDNGRACPECNNVLWREHMQTELIIPDVIDTCRKLEGLLYQDKDEISKKITESLVGEISDAGNINSDENTYVFSCSNAEPMVINRDQKSAEEEINIQEPITESVTSVSKMEVDPHTNVVPSDHFNTPLQFHKLDEKENNGNLSELLNMSSLASPPKSQFSNALSDKEIQDGVQMNPRGIRKKPRITYGKQNKPIKGIASSARNVQDKKLTLQYSMFDFPSDSTLTNTSAVNEPETKTGDNSNEKEKQHVGGNPLQSNNDLDIKRKVKRRSSLIEKCKSKLTEHEIQGTRNNSTKRKMKPKNIEKRNTKGETLLHTACIKGEYDHAKELLELGADPNTKDFAGWTPLHEACNHGQFAIVQLLLDKGALIDMVGGQDNDTPLHDAVSNNQTAVVELLLKKGAPTQIRNRLGLLPIDCAQGDTMKDIFKKIDSKVDNDVINNMVSSNLPKVFLATGLTHIEKGIVQKCAKLLNASITNTFNETVTHVICKCDHEGLCATRTYKYLIGLLTGKWIVSFQWLDDSFKKKKWLSELEYEVKGVTESSAFVPKKSRLNHYKSLPKLFDGCSFYLSGVFEESLSKGKLLELLKLGGGKILHREPKANEVDPLIMPVSPLLNKLNLLPRNCSPMTIYHAKETSSQACCTEYIIYNVKMNPAHKRISSPVLCTAPVSWILDCISNFEILDVRDEHERKDGLISSQT